jgi:hypothetical protein
MHQPISTHSWLQALASLILISFLILNFISYAVNFYLFKAKKGETQLKMYHGHLCAYSRLNDPGNFQK